jgi:hypothetical protein
VKEKRKEMKTNDLDSEFVKPEHLRVKPTDSEKVRD